MFALVYQQRQIPERSDWRAATLKIRSELREGDGVTWSPYWAGEGRLFLHDLPAFHMPQLEGADLSRYQRVWIISAFGHSAEDLPSGHSLLKSQEFGPLRLDLVQVEGEQVVGDLRANLEEAEVSRLYPKGRVRACKFWDGRGWHCDRLKSKVATRSCLGRPIEQRWKRRRKDPHCGLNPWLNVSRDVRVIGGSPRRCVWFHPLKEARVRLNWPSAPAGESLVLDYGFTDKILHFHSKTEPRTQTALLKVFQGEHLIGERQLKPELGWHRWRLPLKGPAAALRFEISTSLTSDAHLCFDPTVRRRR